MQKQNGCCFKREFPLTRTHCGVPLANGRMGALVWGAGNKLCITINRGDIWDHRCLDKIMPGQLYDDLVAAYEPADVGSLEAMLKKEKHPYDEGWELPWRATRLPVGRFELELADELCDATLHYRMGILEVSTKSGTLLIQQCQQKSQLLINDAKGLITAVVSRPSWEWVGDILRKVDFAPPRMLTEPDGWFQPVPNEPGFTAVVQKTVSGKAISLELGSIIPIPAGWDQEKKLNVEYWENFWKDTPTIKLPDEFLTEFYSFALYKFGAATNPSGMVAGLQGPWAEEYQRIPWSGDYHFNVNVQEIYMPAFAAGLWGHLLPLFDFIESPSFMDKIRENAKNLFGIEDGLVMTHATDDQGGHCGYASVAAFIDFSCGAWMGKLYWLYYQHTQDKDFLVNRAYPFIRGVMRGYECTLKEEEDKLIIPIGISPEYARIKHAEGKTTTQYVWKNPSAQLAAAHMLADILLEASQILNIKPSPKWLEIKERVPRYSLITENGESRIGISEGQDLEVCHRLHAHLSAIYPFETCDYADAGEMEIMENSIDHWILRGMGEWSEWCYPMAAILQARMGFKEAPAILMKIWREVFINEGWATVYLPRFRGLTAHRRHDLIKPKETSEVMQLDGTSGAISAIFEMLIHEKNGVVQIFPAVPDAWSNIVFSNIAMRYGFRVSAEREKGQLVKISVRSTSGGSICLAGDGIDGILTWKLKPGETKTEVFGKNSVANR